MTKYSYQAATNTSRGVMSIAGVEFIDRRLTIDEEEAQRAGTLCDSTNTGFLATVLSSACLKPTDGPITPAWVTKHMSSEEALQSVLYIMGGQDRLTLHQAEQTKRLELQVRAQDAALEAEYEQFLALAMAAVTQHAGE